MGLVGSKIRRVARRFNVESRSEKVMDREKPIAAPRHPISEKYAKEYTLDDAVKESISLKDPKLDSFLKDVYVTSHDPPPIKNPKFGKPSERDRMPQYRGIVEDTELGYVEPDYVAEGKITLKQAMKILALAQEDNKKHDSNFVAASYKLPSKTAENLVQYFSSLNVRVNQAGDKTLKVIDSQLEEVARPANIKIEDGISTKTPK